MMTFKSLDCLSQLASSSPVYPVVKGLVEGMMKTNTASIHDGFVFLAEREDLEEELDLFDPPRKLEDVFWEGTHIDRDFFVAVFVPNNQFTLVCVIENSGWLPKDLRRALCACLVPDSL